MVTYESVLSLTGPWPLVVCIGGKFLAALILTLTVDGMINGQVQFCSHQECLMVIIRFVMMIKRTFCEKNKNNARDSNWS